MSRDSDGEFQANYVTSGFMRNLKGYAATGAFPVSAMARAVEFSPIDLVAKAVCLLAGMPDKFTVFHAVNGHWIEMGDVIAAMNKAGLPVETVDEQEFSKRLSEALQDEEKNMLVSGLISYRDVRGRGHNTVRYSLFQRISAGKAKGSPSGKRYSGNT